MAEADPNFPQAGLQRVDDWPTDLRQPRGRQFWREELRDLWYHRTTGIWQPAWIEWVPDIAIGGRHWAQETNGLVTAAREHKLDPDQVRAINTRPSKAVQSEILHSLMPKDIQRRRREAAEGTMS